MKETINLELVSISELLPRQMGIFLLIPKDKNIHSSLQGITFHKTSKDMNCVDDDHDNWLFFNLIDGAENQRPLSKIKGYFKWFVRV